MHSILRRPPLVRAQRCFVRLLSTEPKKTYAGSWYWREHKGGTDPPDAKFMAVAAVVTAAGYYAWFIDPPKKKADEAQRDAESSKA
jgi:hypothetical protein